MSRARFGRQGDVGYVHEGRYVYGRSVDNRSSQASITSRDGVCERVGLTQKRRMREDTDKESGG